jgi:hypothetical protein
MTGAEFGGTWGEAPATEWEQTHGSEGLRDHSARSGAGRYYVIAEGCEVSFASRPNVPLHRLAAPVRMWSQDRNILQVGCWPVTDKQRPQRPA